jgi:hypothetical protein
MIVNGFYFFVFSLVNDCLVRSFSTATLHYLMTVNVAWTAKIEVLMDDAKLFLTFHAR